jgi:hypothetical protein
MAKRSDFRPLPLSQWTEHGPLVHNLQTLQGSGQSEGLVEGFMKRGNTPKEKKKYKTFQQKKKKRKVSNWVQVKLRVERSEEEDVSSKDTFGTAQYTAPVAFLNLRRVAD